MRIAVWDTGHEICGVVSNALATGFIDGQNTIGRLHPNQCEYINDYDFHIAYGILRGTGDIFHQCDKLNKPWFNVDRGYFNPGHYDGYYRISYKGTQAKWDHGFPTTKPSPIMLEPIRKHDKSKPILVCPPTEPVRRFFGYTGMAFDAAYRDDNYVIRPKGDPSPIIWDDYRAVITFNSSVGWQALQQGIPCLSDPLHSVVGSYYNAKSIDEAVELFNTLPRKPLFDFMMSHQFTLAEIAKGGAWPLIRHYLSLSAGTAEKRSLPMSRLTASAGALKHHFQSTT